ncbi:MAG: DUF2723 domain-containing protein [Chloroflexi bacterium]|nr:DUF2723 domain-containing protein [Chloroflexota bacterium]
MPTIDQHPAMLERLVHHKGLLLVLSTFIVVLTAYIRTLMPGTVGGDAGELQYAGPLLALVHPTGQPLYVLLGKIWSELIPFGSIAWRMNLLAAVSAASGAAALGWFVYRIYGSMTLGFSAGLTLAFGATLWGQAVLADKYAFNVLLSAIIIGLALRWEQKPTNNRLLYALSGAFGLSLLHHRSLALFGIGISLMVIWHLRKGLWQNWQRTGICLGLVLVPPLLIYPTVLPLLRANNASPLLWQPSSAGDWIDYLLERHVIENEALVFDSPDDIAAQIEIYTETTTQDYTFIVPVLAIAGFLILLRRRPAAGIFLLLSYGLLMFLSANFRGNERQFTYYLPSYVTLLYAAAIGATAVWDVISGWRLSSIPVKYAAIPGVVALPLIIFLATYPDQRLKAIYGDPLVGETHMWRDTLKSGNMGERLTRDLEALPPDAALAADWEQVTILWYEQQVEKRRPDLMIFYPIERYTDFIGKRPICLARHLPVGQEWHLTNTGALICLQDEPQTVIPRGLVPLNAVYHTDTQTRILKLEGYQISQEPPYKAGMHLPVLLTWRALTPMTNDYSISVQILTENWEPVFLKDGTAWQRDIQSPVMGLYPTSRWTPGEVVNDYHEISIPRDIPPGTYRWTVVVYTAQPDGTFTRLTDTDGNINVNGGVFEVIPD